MLLIKNNARKVRGFTLTEIAIVLGIVGLILGAVWSAASSVYGNANASKFAQILSTYLAQARDVCQNGCTAGTTMASNGVTATPPTGPGITFTSIVGNAPNTGYMLVDWAGIPATSAGSGFCAAMADAISRIGGVPGTTSTNALSVSPTLTCAGGLPTCSAVAGYTVTPVPNGAAACSGPTTPAATARCSAVLTQTPCGSNGVATLGAKFSLSF